MSFQKELEIIRQKNKGLLRPRDVVDYARDPNTALHERFEWDDSVAAEAYRLERARDLIKVVVIMNPRTEEKVKAYVSLPQDRNPDGGYRALVDVLSDKALSEQMLQDALNEIERFRRRYEALENAIEMRELFIAIDKTIAVKSKGRKRKAG